MDVPSTTISLATECNVPILGQMLDEAYGSEAMIAFFFKDWPVLITLLPLYDFQNAFEIYKPSDKSHYDH